VEELIALVADHAMARAAFAEASRRRPGKVIILRQKSRVLADALAEVDDKSGGQYQRREQRVLSSCALARRDR